MGWGLPLLYVDGGWLVVGDFGSGWGSEVGESGIMEWL